MKAFCKRPRILYVTPFCPKQTGTGAEVRSRQVLRSLQQTGSVEVIVLEEERGGNPRNSIGDDCPNVYTIPVKPRPPKRLHEKFRWAFDPCILYPHGCCVTEGGARHVLDVLRGFQMIWFYKLRTANLFPNPNWPSSVVDVDDVPSTFEGVAAQNESKIAERLLARVRQFSWKRRERLLGQRFSVLTTCSEGDRQYLIKLGVNNSIHVIPNGMNRPRIEPVPNPISPSRIGFVGLFDYRPNREGIAWFVRECWPRIKAQVPSVRLRLIGLGSDGPLKPAGPDIDGLGWQQDLEQEIATWSASIVPIQLGAGTRVKIAQGFSQKCPIVSTTHGAYGYEVVNGRELMIADSAAAFANACLRLIQSPDEARQLAERAWQLFLNKWTWDAIAPRIWQAVEDCIRQNAGHPGVVCAERALSTPQSRM